MKYMVSLQVLPGKEFSGCTIADKIFEIIAHRILHNLANRYSQGDEAPLKRKPNISLNKSGLY